MPIAITTLLWSKPSRRRTLGRPNRAVFGAEMAEGRKICCLNQAVFGACFGGAHAARNVCPNCAVLNFNLNPDLPQTTGPVWLFGVEGLGWEGGGAAGGRGGVSVD